MWGKWGYMCLQQHITQVLEWMYCYWPWVMTVRCCFLQISVSVKNTYVLLFSCKVAIAWYSDWNQLQLTLRFAINMFWSRTWSTTWCRTWSITPCLCRNYNWSPCATSGRWCRYQHLGYRCWFVYSTRRESMSIIQLTNGRQLQTVPSIMLWIGIN